MSPVVLALAASIAVALLFAGTGAALLAWRRGGDAGLRRRLRRAAAPLAGPAAAEGASGEESIFRPVESRTWASGLRDRIEARYPLLEARQALPAALGVGIAGAAGGWFSIWFLQIPAGWWTAPAAALAGAGAGWYALRVLQARQTAEFVRQFPEVVDQIVRLAGAGVPPLEAIATVADDTPKPVAPILGRVRDGLLAGLDTDTTLRLASERVRIPEFTLFSAVLRLQRHAGGGISAAFRNLAATLRERRRTTLKARASTAQTRLTLAVLAAMPIVVLVAQKFTSPQSIEILFGTEEGTTLLRWGVALIVTGLLVARALAARAVR